MVFSEKLSHQFELVNHQTASGLYNLKRTALTLKQLSTYGGVDAPAIVQSNVMKCTKHEHESGADHQVAYHVATSTILSTLAQVIDTAHKGFLTKIQNEIATPLQNFYQMSEKMRLKLTDEAHKYTAELASAKSALAKERDACMSAYAGTVSKKKQIAALTGEKQAKAQKKYPAMEQKLADYFAGYEASVNSVNELQALYHSKRMPTIVNELEALERSRLAKISDVFEAFSAALTSHVDQLKAIHDNVLFIPATLNQDASITHFTENLLAKHGRAIPVPALSYDLPVSASEVRAGELTKPGLAAPMRKAPIIPVDSSTLKAQLSAKYTLGSSKASTLRLRRKEILDVRAKAMESAPQPQRIATAEEDHLHELKTDGSNSAPNSPPQSPTFSPRSPPEAGGVHEGSVVIANHDYTAAADDEMSFKKGDKFVVVKVDGIWWTATNSAQETGLIPSNFFSAEAESKTEGLTCVVLHDYTPDPGPDQDDYLKLIKGDTLTAQPRSEDWWFGTCNGRSGFFPMTFVQVTSGGTEI